MDSPNPYTQSSSFVDLLNSQPQSHNLQHNHDDNVSPSIELVESEVPLFSTQWSDAPTQSKDCRPRRKWSPTEDIVLISAWLNTSKYPIIGNEQKAEAFWKRITAYFAASPKLSGLPKRELSNCKKRWGKINDVVCKFVGCYEAATSQKSSGQNENDVMKLANQIFCNDYKSKFTMEHAWRELRHDQKWCKQEGTGMSKRRRTEEGSTQSSSSHPLSHGEDESARPPGVKASKAKGKKNDTNATTVIGDGKSLLEYQSMWEIKQKDFVLKEKDFAMKEKLGKHKMLESLLAKTEPLSDIEMALKNKLITDMLSNA